MQQDNRFLSIAQIERDLRQMLKSIDRTSPEGEFFYLSILNILRWRTKG